MVVVVLVRVVMIDLIAYHSIVLTVACSKRTELVEPSCHFGRPSLMVGGYLCEDMKLSSPHHVQCARE